MVQTKSLYVFVAIGVMIAISFLMNNEHGTTKYVMLSTESGDDSMMNIAKVFCSDLPSFKSHILKNNFDVLRLLAMDPLIIEEFAYLLEPYISCIPWSDTKPPQKPPPFDMKKIENECKQYPEVFSGKLNESPLFVVDLFAFGWEMDVFEIRINSLYHLVDHFVVLEDIYGQRIAKKPLYFELNKFKRFKELDPLNKIIHFIKDDTNNYNLRHEYFFENASNRKFWDTKKKNNERHLDWRNENFFRLDGWLKYIQNIYDNDIDLFLSKHNESLLLISDLDEVPDPNKLALLKYCEVLGNVKSVFWNNSNGRVIESSYQFFQHNFNIFWFDRGIKSFVFKMDKDLHQKFVKRELCFDRNGDSTVYDFEWLAKIGYTGWHLSHLQKPYEMLMKNLYMSELYGSFHDAVCKSKEWAFVSLWNDHEEINLDYLKIAHSENYTECVKEVMLNPYYAKAIMDNAIYVPWAPRFKNESYFTRSCYAFDTVYPLPEYVALNAQKYAFFFPKFCSLKNENNDYDYDCNFTKLAKFYDVNESSWRNISRFYENKINKIEWQIPEIFKVRGKRKA